MSSFIVSESCMHMVAYAVFEARGVSETRSSGEAITQIGRELFALNEAAFGARYPGDDSASYSATYQFVRGLPPARVAAYKALRCFLYQCSEGNVPESPLFKEVDDVAAILAARIIQSLPEYNASAWG